MAYLVQIQQLGSDRVTDNIVRLLFGHTVTSEFMVSVLLLLLWFIHHMWLEKCSMHRNPRERLKFALKIWFGREDMFSTQGI